MGKSRQELWEDNARLRQELAEITRKYRALDGGWGDMEQVCDNLQVQLAEARAENEQLKEELSKTRTALSGLDAALDVLEEFMHGEEDETT